MSTREEGGRKFQVNNEKPRLMKKQKRNQLMKTNHKILHTKLGIEQNKPYKSSIVVSSFTCGNCGIAQVNSIKSHIHYIFVIIYSLTFGKYVHLSHGKKAC